MKDKLVRDIELRLSLFYGRQDMEKIMQCVMAALMGYEVTEQSTELTVRHEDINERLIKRYVACVRIDGKSEKTIEQYARLLARFGEAAQKPFTEMDATDIRMFLGDIKVSGAQNSTVENYRAYISAFFHWLAAEEIIEKTPAEKVKPIKCEEKVRLPFTSVHIDKLRLACESQRDRAIIEVMLSSGVRIEELCALTIDDVDIRSKSLRVKCGKGGKGRKTFISDVAAHHLELYLNSRKDSETVLFRRRRGAGAIKTDGVRFMLKGVSERAGVDNVHPHRFRRTFATDLYRRGMDIHEIQRLMGHSNIQTTLEYIYTDDAQLQDAYRKYAA